MKSNLKRIINQKLISIVGVSLAIFIDLLLSKLMASWSYSWLPVQASAAAPYVDNLFAFETGIGTFIFLGCSGVIGWVLIFNRAPKYDESFGEPIEGNTNLEIVWTVTPSFILMVIAIPSFALLYSMDEIVDPSLTLKVIGHQWYWTYEYSDYSVNDEGSIVFDSYMIPEDDLELGQLRLLEVDNRVVLPVNTHIRIIITAADVLHSWAVPALGIKCDAVPGRLNQTSLFLKREGVFYGQCSEICGANHGFMPIVVEGVQLNDYLNWVSNKLEDM